LQDLSRSSKISRDLAREAWFDLFDLVFGAHLWRRSWKMSGENWVVEQTCHAVQILRSLKIFQLITLAGRRTWSASMSGSAIEPMLMVSIQS
jgi:hypothetical protein